MDKLKPVYGNVEVKVAPWWLLLLARYFGTSLGIEDGAYVFKGYQWRGKIYIAKMRNRRQP
jgi:hypothetical protein